jgi:hypothetical protein
MATLVLTTVGTAIAGPVGGAIGAIVGQAADQRLFAPKARHGPRLGELAVQTSSYGSQLPKIFGALRVAGTVIWATDLVEIRASSGGGKGRPKSVSYSYAANFAVALSGRPIRAIHRIWADGKLLRGANGDFKARIGAFRVHTGGEDQAADPLIAAAEGSASTPAYRGLAYAVFEDLQLEDYGNRIPSLSFEVEADAGEVPIGRIAEELSDGDIEAGATPSVLGYAATGDSVRSAVEALADIVPLTLASDGRGPVLRVPGGAATLAPRSAYGSTLETCRRAAGTVAGEVALSYYDPLRDHQAGLQRARGTGPAARSDRRELPAALAPEQAKRFAEDRLATLWAARSSAKMQLGWRYVAIRPGSAVVIEKEAGLWIVERWLLGQMTLDLELRRLPPAEAAPSPASAGRAVTERDLVHGPTVLRLLDLPLPMERGEGAWIAALAAGASPGWRRALLTASFDNGDSWDDVGPTAEPAIIGTVHEALAPSTAALIDDVNSFDLELLHSGMWIEARTDAALSAGANLALLGSELLQFGRVEQLSDRRYRISRLLRGRRGTEYAASGHGPDEPFTLLTTATVLPLAVPEGAIGTTAILAAVGVGDAAEGATASCLVTGEALRPPAPVHLQAATDASGELAVRWTRRSRRGWTWQDEGETPLGEEAEAYRVTIASAGATRAFDLDRPFFSYSAAQRTADGMNGPLAIKVVQLGTHGASRAAEIIFP